MNLPLYTPSRLSYVPLLYHVHKTIIFHQFPIRAWTLNFPLPNHRYFLSPFITFTRPALTFPALSRELKHRLSRSESTNFTFFYHTYKINASFFFSTLKHELKHWICFYSIITYFIFLYFVHKTHAASLLIPSLSPRLVLARLPVEQQRQSKGTPPN